MQCTVKVPYRRDLIFLNHKICIKLRRKNALRLGNLSETRISVKARVCSPSKITLYHNVWSCIIQKLHGSTWLIQDIWFWLGEHFNKKLDFHRRSNPSQRSGLSSKSSSRKKTLFFLSRFVATLKILPGKRLLVFKKSAFWILLGLSTHYFW